MQRYRTISLSIFILFIAFSYVKAEDLDVEFGGFIKLDVAADTNGGPNILLADEDKGTRLGITTRATRLSVTLRKKETVIGPLRAYVEADFSGTANAIVPQKAGLLLRHASVEAGNFLIGQAFTTFGDLAGLLDLLDYNAHAGNVYTRQAQIRYTKKWNKFSVRFAIENSLTNLGNGNITNDQRLPDFITRIDYDSPWGHFSSAGMLRELRVDNGAFDAHKMVLATAFVFTKEIIPEKLKFTAQYSRGVLGAYGAYTVYYGDGELLENARGERVIEPLIYQLGVAGITYNWAPKWRSTLMLSWSKSLEPGQNTQTLGTGRAIEEGKWLHANIYYELTKGFELAVEYKKEKAKFSDNTYLDVDRIQFSMIYRL